MKKASQFGRLNIAKMILPKVIYQFDAIPIKIMMKVYCFNFEKEKPILKFLWDLKSIQTAKAILKKNSEDSHFLISKFATELCSSKQRGTGLTTDKTNGIEKRSHKYILTCVVN